MSTFRGWPDSRRDPAPMQGPGGWPEVGNLAGWANIARRLNRRHPISAGLVGWWPMDEGQGSRIRDLSIYGNHGTATGMADPATATSGWGAGVSQRELAWDGTNDYILVPHSASLAIVGDMTLSIWVKSSFSSYGMLINKGASGVCNPYQWFIFGGGGPRIMGRGNGSVEAVVYNSSLDVPVNTWTHVAATMSGTTVAHYTNGAYAGGGALSTTIADSGGPLYIGRRGDGFYIQTMMRHARVYNRALSAAEVKQIYADPWIGAY